MEKKERKHGRERKRIRRNDKERKIEREEGREVKLGSMREGTKSGRNGR